MGETERDRGRSRATGNLHKANAITDAAHTRALAVANETLALPSHCNVQAATTRPHRHPRKRVHVAFRVRVLVWRQCDTGAKHAHTATFKIELMDGLCERVCLCQLLFYFPKLTHLSYSITLVLSVCALVRGGWFCNVSDVLQAHTRSPGRRHT
jgi:hypothetical protein